MDWPRKWNGVPVPYGASLADLRARAESSGPEAWAALIALSASAEPAALEVIVAATRSPDPHVRRAGHVRSAAERAIRALEGL